MGAESRKFEEVMKKERNYIIIYFFYVYFSSRRDVNNSGRATVSPKCPNTVGIGIVTSVTAV